MGEMKQWLDMVERSSLHCHRSTLDLGWGGRETILASSWGILCTSDCAFWQPDKVAILDKICPWNPKHTGWLVRLQQARLRCKIWAGYLAFTGNNQFSELHPKQNWHLAYCNDTRSHAHWPSKRSTEHSLHSLSTAEPCRHRVGGGKRWRWLCSKAGCLSSEIHI